MTVAVSDGKTTLSDRVAEEIRALMARRRITGRQIARELGVSGAWVSYRLSGTQPIDLNDLEKIASVLGVSFVQLLPPREVRKAMTDNGGVTTGERNPVRPVNRRDPVRPGGVIRPRRLTGPFVSDQVAA